MYSMADMPVIRLARASQSPRRATYVLMPASKLIRILLTKVTKCCAQGESKRRLATFAFTGTAAINAEHLEHY